MTNIGGESGNGSKNNGTKYRMQYMLEYECQASEKRAGLRGGLCWEAFVFAAKILKFWALSYFVPYPLVWLSFNKS